MALRHLVLPWDSQRPDDTALPRREWAALFDFARGPHDLIGTMGAMFPLPSNARDARQAGPGFRFGTGDVSTTTGRIVPGISAGLTAVMVAEALATTTANNFIFAESSASVGAYNWGFYETSGGVLRAFVHNGSTGVAHDTGYSWSSTRSVDVFVMTYGDGDNFIRVYRNGAELNSGTAQTGNIQRNTGAHLSVQRWNTTGCSMLLYAAAVAPRCMPAAEVLRKFGTLTSTWDALFEPQQIWVPKTTAGNFAAVGSGGLQFAGSAVSGYSSSHSYAASGGFSLSGGASASQTSDFAFYGSGGLLVAGAAVAEYAGGFTAVGSGGISVAGSAPTSQSSNFAAVGGGGLVLGGQAASAQASDFSSTGSGGILLSGSAPAQQGSGFSASGSGGISLGGDAAEAFTSDFNFTSSGGLTLGGDATEAVTSNFAATSSGSVGFAGAAVASMTTVGGTGATAEEITAAVLAALNAATIPVNVKRVNDVTIIGAGVPGNSFRPA